MDVLFSNFINNFTKNSLFEAVAILLWALLLCFLASLMSFVFFQLTKMLQKFVLSNLNNVKEFDERKLSYISSNETNYLAFDLPSEEYHNELYESLMEKYSTSNGIKRFDNEFFIQQKKEDKIYPWEKQPNQVSIHTFIRNQIHHRKDNRGC